MNIFFDVSEARQGTRLPQAVIERGCAINGLEAATGADGLVSPLMLPLRDIDESEPSLILLKKHIDAGMLFQRKSGRDALNSIPKYPEILERMLHWTRRPYLITIGQFGSTREGNVIVDGQETNWNYNAFMGSLDWWSLNGGYHTNLSRDGQLGGYLNLWLERLASKEWQAQGTTKKVYQRIPKQILGEPDWVSVVLSLGVGFGTEKADYLQHAFSGLGDFLAFFSNEANLSICDGKGIGKSHFRKVRALLNAGKDVVFEMNTIDQEETE